MGDHNMTLCVSFATNKITLNTVKLQKPSYSINLLSNCSKFCVDNILILLHKYFSKFAIKA